MVKMAGRLASSHIRNPDLLSHDSFSLVFIVLAIINVNKRYMGYISHLGNNAFWKWAKTNFTWKVKITLNHKSCEISIHICSLISFISWIFYLVGEKFQTKVEKRKFAQQLSELVKSMTDVNPDESNSWWYVNYRYVYNSKGHTIGPYHNMILWKLYHD